MHDAVMERASASDVIIMAAAVADFRPVDVADAKIKKTKDKIANNFGAGSKVYESITGKLGTGFANKPVEFLQSSGSD